MPGIEVFAPAKVNLALHVTGQRQDGYHLLDSLVAFAPVGDRIMIEPAEGRRLRVTGPQAAGVPGDGTNLVMKAVERFGPGAGVRLTLDKHLPSASGIGGGSSDAAATLRGMAALHGERALPQGIETLGADVPMCLDPRPARIRGIGEEIAPVALPPLPALLVNPRIKVSTPAIFKALTRKDNPPLPEVPAFPDAVACIDWIAARRNDLQAPAVALVPVIGRLLDMLATLPGCRLARMSGSGATCFALFATDTEAAEAHARLATDHPAWWSAHGPLGDQSAAAQPRPL